MDQQVLLMQYKPVAAEFLQLLNTFGEKALNTVPFEGSWTAGQVCDHVTQFTHGTAYMLSMQGTAGRAADARVEELKTIFLDFDQKMQAPEFVLPQQDVYEKTILLGSLDSAITGLKNALHSARLDELLNIPGLGELSKLEAVYFVIYHTQRHTQQLRRIATAIEIIPLS